MSKIGSYRWEGQEARNAAAAAAAAAEIDEALEEIALERAHEAAIAEDASIDTADAWWRERDRHLREGAARYFMDQEAAIAERRVRDIWEPTRDEEVDAMLDEVAWEQFGIGEPPEEELHLEAEAGLFNYYLMIDLIGYGVAR